MISSVTCPLEAPSYYIITLHLIAGFSVPINILSMYFIWFQSPNIGKYKLCLTYLQVVAFFIEIYMSWICPSYYYFPMPGGYNTSWLSKYISSHTSFCFYFFLFCFQLPALVVCFEYRLYVAKELENSRKSGRWINWIFIIFAHTYPFITVFCLLNSELTLEQQYESVRVFYPKCVSVVSRQGFLMYDYHSNPWSLTVAWIGIFYLIIFSLYLASLAARTFVIIHAMRIHISQQTYKMHRTAMISLSLQCCVPVICLIIPITVIFIIVIYDLAQYQELATDTMFILSSHSMTASLVFIMSNRRYRTLISSRIMRKFRGRQNQPEGVVSIVLGKFTSS